jgi:hypothetical protein
MCQEEIIGPSSLSVPTLAVFDTADDVAPPNSLKPFAAAMAKNVRIIEYPGELGVCLQHLGSDATLKPMYGWKS